MKTPPAASPFKISALLISLAFVGCAGPEFFFDPAPAPGWLVQTTSDISPVRIQMVGTTPTTTQLKNDHDLALRDAKNQIAQLFMSQVVSRTSDWSLTLGREESDDRQVLSQNIEVRTNVKVDNVKVVKTYRDEETRTHYVLVTVDRRAWATRINLKTETAFTELNHHLETARKALQANRPLKGYKALLGAYQRGQELQPDIVVLELLAPKQGAERKLNQLHSQLQETGQALRDHHQFDIQVTARNPRIAEDARTTLETFLNGYGFTTGSGGGAIRVEAVLDERFLNQERVAGRDEFVYSAVGSLRVVEPSGAEFTSLSFHLSPNAYTQQHRNRDRAIESTLRLAADTVTSKFRSLFRKEFPKASD